MVTTEKMMFPPSNPSIVIALLLPMSVLGNYYTENSRSLGKPPASFITSMEEYVKEVPQPLMIQLDEIKEQIVVTPRAGGLIEDFEFELDQGGAESASEEDATKGKPEGETATTISSREAPVVDLLFDIDWRVQVVEIGTTDKRILTM